MTQRSKEVRSDEIADRSGKKRDALFPPAGTHIVHHPDRQRRFQHRNAHVGEGDRSGGHDDVRIHDQGLQRGWIGFLDHHRRLQHHQLEQTVAEGQRRQDQEGGRFAHEFVHDASEGWTDEDAEGKPPECDAHGVAALLVVGVPIGQHSHAGHGRTGRPDSLQCSRQEQNGVRSTEGENWEKEV